MKIIKLILDGDGKGNGLNARKAPDAPSQSVVAAQAFSQFAQNFRNGPTPNDLTLGSNRGPDGAEPRAQAALNEFLGNAADTLQDVRKLFSDISRSPSLPARQQILTNICLQLGEFKMQLGAFHLRPAWQLASALEGLFQQLIDNPSQLTLSTLRTAASALVLLDRLCVVGLRPDLAHNPTVHILAVDDDLISCQAILMSLKQTFAPPDVAQDGETALFLAAQKSYEIVFLDVEMPGMDGFEVCTRIHELDTNRNTPVVFVTSHSDFESRSKSASSGGKDLIAKPFLSFEITVKALTLVLRKRLDEIKVRQPETIASPTLVAG
jgi:CheY-like chemotaxis protein